MPRAGYSGTVKASGVAVVMTGEACTSLGGNRYQVTNSAKRIVDPNTNLVVLENGIASVLAYTFDHLFGIVSFPSAPTAPITVTGAYLPVESIAESKGFTVALSRDMLDTTSFDSAGARAKLAGLKDGTIKLDRVSAFDDIDTVTVGLQTVESRFAAGTPYVVELGLGGTDLFRAWCLTENLELGSAVDGLVTETVAFQLAPQPVTSSILTARASWAFSS